MYRHPLLINFINFPFDCLYGIVTNLSISRLKSRIPKYVFAIRRYMLVLQTPQKFHGTTVVKRSINSVFEFSISNYTLIPSKFYNNVFVISRNYIAIFLLNSHFRLCVLSFIVQFGIVCTFHY